MEGQGAFNGCLRCLIQGVTCLRTRVYLDYKRFLPAGSCHREGEIGKAPRLRNHDATVRQGKQAERTGRSVKGVCGECVFTRLPYFRMDTNWVLDTPMHLVKGMFQAHVLRALNGKRCPAAVKSQIDKEKEEKKIQQRAEIVARLDKFVLKKESQRRGDKAYAEMEGPPGYTKRRPEVVTNMHSKQVFNSHELLQFVETSAVHILDVTIEDDEVNVNIP